MTSPTPQVFQMLNQIGLFPASKRARFTALVPVLALDERAAADYGSLSALVRELRRNVLDRLIAAHARSVNAVLVTNKEADFRDMPGLVVENWVGG